MRSADPTGPPARAPIRSETDLVDLTIRLANEPALVADGPAWGVDGPAWGVDGPARGAEGPTPPQAGPLTGRVAAPAASVLRSSTPPPDRPWAVPLLVTPEAEAWLLGWPAGLVTRAHDHGGATVALTVVEGSLSEECLDPTIWTTGRRTTWRAGASTLFPRGHVHLLGAAGHRPAVAVHAWSGPAGSAERAAGRLAAGRCGPAGRGPGRGRGAEPVGLGPGRGRDGCWVGQPAHGALDLGHVRDRVAG